MTMDIWTYVFYTIFGVCVIFGIKFIVPSKLNDQNEIVVDPFRPGFYIFIFFYTIVVGLRYNVGIDYEGYTEWFEYFKLTGKFDVENEIGFRAIIYFLTSINLPSESLFLVLAFLQISFLILAVNRLFFLKGWYFFFFFVCLIFFISMNAMRQTIAYYIFFWGYYYFLDKKYLKYIGIILFGTLLHITIVIPAMVGVCLRGNLFKSRALLISLLVVGDSLFPLILESFFKLIFPVVDWLGYGYYINAADILTKFTEENKTGDGLGFILMFIIDGLIIYFSSKMKEEFKDNFFIPFFNLFIIGVILSRAFAENFVFMRIAEYFIHFRALMLAFLCVYFNRKRTEAVSNYVKFSTLQSMIIVGMLFFFYKAIFNNAAGCRPWAFIIFNY